MSEAPDDDMRNPNAGHHIGRFGEIAVFVDTELNLAHDTCSKCIYNEAGKYAEGGDYKHCNKVRPLSISNCHNGYFVEASDE